MAVMAKASVPGRAKTRLIPQASADGAAALNTAFIQDIASNLLEARLSVPIAPYIAYGPPGAESFFREHIAPEVGLLECIYPDFGECLLRAIAWMLGAGHGAACVVNSDSPTLPTRLLIEAAQALSRPGDRVVLGPSTDGGYYLLGLKHAHRRLFEDIDWSTAVVAAQTRDRAAEIGLDLVLLDPWYDVDDSEALRQLVSQLLATPTRPVIEPASDPASELAIYPAPNTRAALLHLFGTTDLAARLDIAVPPIVRLSAR
jgi:rSAM/selenodomain-associated transferase 1